jgi:hypothetical protein
LAGTAQNFAKYHKKLKMLGQSSEGDEIARMQRYRIKCKDKKWSIKIKKEKKMIISNNWNRVNKDLLLP